MKLGVALTSAFEALSANVLRSFLTMLGIMIGVASVMAMLSISQGAARQVEEQIASLGATKLTIRPGADRRGGRSGGAGSSTPFTDADVEELALEPYAEAVSGQNQSTTVVVAGEENWSTSIVGATAAWFETQPWEVSAGEILTERDIRAGAANVVIGETIAEVLFDGVNPLGQRIRANNVPLTVVGVLEEKGQSNFGGDRDDLIVVPITTYRNRIIGASRTTPKNVSRIEVVVSPAYDLAETQVVLEERLRELRRIRPGDADDFRVFNIADFIRARDETQATFRVLLGFTAAVSLIVGGVGVMNIMLVSVTERTREIGLRMAIGARKADILGQFLSEAVVLCVVGGLIGSALGVGAANLAAQLGDFPVTISPIIAFVALGASAAVGLFFGFFPARRAARLHPIEALRHE